MYSQIEFTEQLTLGTYAVCVTIGVVLMFVLYLFRGVNKYKIKEDSVIFAVQMLLISIGVGFISGIVFDALFKIPENGQFVIEGTTFYGGLIGGVLSYILIMSIFKKKTNISVIKWLNILAPGIALAHFFGRVGCYLGGCCYGHETDSWLGVIFPHGSPSYHDLGEHAKVYPTQLFEAFALLIIFFILIKFIKKNQFYLYLILYGIARFFIEFYRGDDRGNILGISLSPAQIISIILILIASWMLIIQKIKISQQLGYEYDLSKGISH